MPSSLERAFPTVAKLLERRKSKRPEKLDLGSGPPRPNRPQKPGRRGRRAVEAPAVQARAAEAPDADGVMADGVAATEAGGAQVGAKRAKRAAAPKQRRRRAPVSIVGLDIDPGHVIAAQVKVNGRLEVQRAVGLPLPVEVFRDGELADPLVLTRVLMELFDGSGLPNRVRIGLANQRIMVRTIELPQIPNRDELTAAVRFQAQDQIPMPLDSVVLDHQTLEIVETPEGLRQRVLLVAARREMIERLLEAVEAAGLRPEGIDLSAFALIRALHTPGADESERVLYLNLAGLTNIALAQGSTCEFTRVLSVGLESLIAQVAERCAISFDAARALLRGVGMQDEAPAVVPAHGEPLAHEPIPQPPTTDLGLPATHELAPFSDTPADTAAPPSLASAPVASEGSQLSTADQREVVRVVLADGVRQIAAEIGNSLAYHSGPGQHAPNDRIVASGPATEVPGLVEGLAAELGAPISTVTVAASPGSIGSVPLSRLAVAAGLAVVEAPA
jgi:type IV pilus assembly protein PilM